MAEDDPPGSGTEVITADASDGWSELPESLPIALPEGQDRYRIEADLGRGSMGVVKVARDLSLERTVALKQLNPEGVIPNAAARFLDEARITAQLQHPGIVAVYEINVDADERPFFAMQLVEGRTLKEIVDGLNAGDPEILRRFTPVRLFNVFNQVCMAVAYAHGRGVIHRDLKPENIMLGEYGEVFVMDWGLAKIVDAEVLHPVVGGRPDEAAYRTQVGDITGTPTYMSPEQALGFVDALDHKTDIYALGAILYELLTLCPPFTGPTAGDILRQVRAGALQPPSRAAPDRDVPAALEAVVLRAMERDPLQRFESAAALRDEVEAYLAGGHTRQHRVRNSARMQVEAGRAAQVFRDQARRLRRSAREYREQEAVRLPFDEVAKVQAQQARRQSLDEMEAELWRTFETAVALYHRILHERPDAVEAHEGLRDLLWYRFLEAERLGDGSAMAMYRSLIAQHDPHEQLRAALKGDGSLRLQTTQVAQVHISRYESDGLRLVPTQGKIVGSTPLLIEPLPMGSYLIELSAPGFSPVRVPVSIARQEAAELHVDLLPIGRLPDGMVQVPTGPAWLGTQNLELQSPPRQRVLIDAFAVGRSPVTVGDWAEFVNEIDAQGDPRRTEKLAKVTGAWVRGADGRLHPEAHPRNPITGVSWREIEAYLVWRHARDGLPWRLPTASEWEKAARGVDGRRYPWGNYWDAAQCRCRDSPEGGAASPVGDQNDQSPYGVCDLSGGVREWTHATHPEQPRTRIIKGGGFDSLRPETHLASRRFRKQERGAIDIGFRLALDLSALRS